MSSNLSALFAKAKKVSLISVKSEPLPEPEPEPEPEESSEKPKRKSKSENIEINDSPVANDRTIFVGNVPSGCSQKELKRLFSQFGTVQSVRLRNLVPLDPKHSKRVAFIKKELHPMQKAITAFVCFEDSVEAQSATSLNGYLYKDHHLRVDLAHDKQTGAKHDNKRSIFIGNLPFDAQDDDVRNIFEECGDVEGVRLVRDRATSVGKGFGYVLFKDEASVALALSMNGNYKLANREIRIKPAVKKPKMNKDQSSPRKRFIEKPKLKKKKKSTERKDPVAIQQGRVEKRPAVKLRKESDKKKKKKKLLTTKTNNTNKGVIQLKKKG